jgi:hypothetical protein
VLLFAYIAFVSATQAWDVTLLHPSLFHHSQFQNSENRSGLERNQNSRAQAKDLRQFSNSCGVFTAVLQFLPSLWVGQCGVSLTKTPLSGCGCALHRLENRYGSSNVAFTSTPVEEKATQTARHRVQLFWFCFRMLRQYETVERLQLERS